MEGISKTVGCNSAIRHEPNSLPGFIFRILKGPLNVSRKCLLIATRRFRLQAATGSRAIICGVVI